MNCFTAASTKNMGGGGSEEALLRDSRMSGEEFLVYIPTI